jgi:hypothetical protein
MNHKQREILEDQDYWVYDFDYENELGFEYYDDYYISYERLESGLVDWTEEIPQAVKRQHKIDQILNDNLEDNLNNLGKFWPKNNI